MCVGSCPRSSQSYTALGVHAFPDSGPLLLMWKTRWHTTESVSFLFQFRIILTFGFLSLHVCVCVCARAFVHVHVYMKGRAQLFSWHHPPHRSSTDQRSIWTAAASTCALAAHIFNLYTSQRTAVTAPLRVICSLPVCAVVRLPKSNGPRETAHTDDEQHCSTPMTLCSFTASCAAMLLVLLLAERKQVY